MGRMERTTTASRTKLSPEFWAIIGLGVAALGQTIWLDGKIERVDTRLDAKIAHLDSRLNAKIERLEAGVNAKIERLETSVNATMDRMQGELVDVAQQIGGLQEGQRAIRERLSALEGHVLGVGVAGRGEPTPRTQG